MIKYLMNKEMLTLIVSQLFFGMVGALFIHLILMHKTPRAIATVNIIGLEDSFIRETENLHLNPVEMEKKVKSFANILNKTVVTIAKQKDVVLLPSEAVIAGSPDFTEEIANQVKRGLSK